MIPFWTELKKHIATNLPISEEAIDLIKPYVSFRTVRKGELLYEEGKACKNVYCIKSGIFRNFITYDGNTKTRWFAIEGDFFTSSYSLSTGSCAQTSVEAVMKGEIWEVSLSYVNSIVRQNEEWNRWLLKMLIDGLGSWELRDRILVSGDSYERFKKFYTIKPMNILNQIPLQHVASYLGITPQTLSLFRKRLAKEED